MPVTLQQLLLKYKLLHVVMWLCVFTSTFLAYHEPGTPVVPLLCNTLSVIVFSTIPFYVTAYTLVPRFLYKKEYTKFIVSLILLIVSSGLVTLLAARTIDHLFDPSKDIIEQGSKLRQSVNIFVWNSILAAFGSGGLKIMSDSFRLRSKLRETEKEKVSTELNFLRSQVNPHFLFNVMNTIYFQIDKQNVQARGTVEKFSEMLRYQLYECTSDNINIRQEIEYIRNYVAIQTLRMESGSDIRLEINKSNFEFKIAPMLILPIVENAFKHVSTFKTPAENKIRISLGRSADQYFLVEAVNTFDTNIKTQHLIQSGGLGIQNLKRRLELLYPGAYEFSSGQQENVFKTILKIKIND
jgi:two-component system LytT family sensor kinase